MKWWLFCLLSLTVIVIPPSHSCTFFMSLMCSLASIHFIFLGTFSDITFLSFSEGYCARIRKILLFLLHFCLHFIFINCPTLPCLPVICFLFHWMWAFSSHGVRMLNEQMEGLMGWIDWLFHFPFARVSSECVDVVIYFNSCRCIALVESSYALMLILAAINRGNLHLISTSILQLNHPNHYPFLLTRQAIHQKKRERRKCPS